MQATAQNNAETRTWQWHGRYGDSDDPKTVRIKCMPSELSIEQQLKLVEAYKSKDTHDVWEFETLGLCCEVGNAWNTNILWSPQVSAWVNELKAAAQPPQTSPDSFSDFSP